MKNFIKIWAGELISNIGSGMTAFALSIYTYRLTGSVTWVSIVTMLAYLPTILLNPIGGILADRLDRRLMMICGDLFSAFGLIYILISIQAGSNSLAPIIIGVTINSVFVSLLDPAYKATITDLLTAEEYAKASGLVQIASNAKFLISPAIAGLILGIWDIRVILIIDILTIFITVFTIALASGLVCAAVITLTQLFTSISSLYETASFNFINKYYVWRHCKYQFLFIITNPFHLGDSHA